MLHNPVMVCGSFKVPCTGKHAVDESMYNSIAELLLICLILNTNQYAACNQCDCRY